LDSFFLMIGSYLIGARVLGMFGVSLPVVQVAGGLVVVVMGWTMLMKKDELAAGDRRAYRGVAIGAHNGNRA